MKFNRHILAISAMFILCGIQIYPGQPSGIQIHPGQPTGTRPTHPGGGPRQMPIIPPKGRELQAPPRTIAKPGLLPDPGRPAIKPVISAEKKQELQKYATMMVDRIQAALYGQLNELASWIKTFETALRTETTTVAQLLQLLKISDKAIGEEVETKVGLAGNPIVDEITQILTHMRRDELLKQGIKAKLDEKGFRENAKTMLQALSRMIEQLIIPMTMKLGPQMTKAQFLEAFGVTENETIGSIVNKVKAFFVNAITSILVQREVQNMTSKPVLTQPAP